MVDGRNLYGHDRVRVRWPALDANDIPADSIMQIRGGPSQVSGRKISEAKNESTDTFYDPATNRLLLDAKISLCACPRVVSKYLVPGSVEDRPCVSECDTSHVGDN